MIVIYLLLLVVSCVCLAIAAFGKPGTKVDFLAAGLLAFVLVPLIQTMVRLAN